MERVNMKLKLFSQFLIEAKKKSNPLKDRFIELLEQRHTNLSDDVFIIYESVIKQVLKEKFPKLYHVSNEENTNLISHIANQTKNPRLFNKLVSEYITDYGIFSPKTYCYTLEIK
jgi:hypothetical protein